MLGEHRRSRLAPRPPPAGHLALHRLSGRLRLQGSGAGGPTLRQSGGTQAQRLRFLFIGLPGHKRKIQQQPLPGDLSDAGRVRTQQGQWVLAGTEFRRPGSLWERQGRRVGEREPPHLPRAGMEPQLGWGPDSEARVVSSQQAQGRPLQTKLTSTRLLSQSPTTMKAESDSGKELEN